MQQRDVQQLVYLAGRQSSEPCHQPQELLAVADASFEPAGPEQVDELGMEEQKNAVSV